MRRTVLVRIATLLVAVLSVAELMAQAPAPDRRADIIRMIERRWERRQPLELSADSITLEGDVLRLKGSVMIVCGADTYVRANEALLDRATKRVQLIGNVWASLGPSSGVPVPRPRIDYR